MIAENNKRSVVRHRAGGRHPTAARPAATDTCIMGWRAAYIIHITFGGALWRVRAAVPPYGLQVARDKQDGRGAGGTCAGGGHRHAATRRAPRRRRVQRRARAAAAGRRARRRPRRAQRAACETQVEHTSVFCYL